MIPMPGKPFQSKLEPLYEFIRESRSKRWSYQKIADVLTREKGLAVSANAIFSFVKVRAKRRSLYALPPLESPPSFPAATTKAREFFTSPSTKQPHETKQRPYNI
jgi:IS30 family transposase